MSIRTPASVIAELIEHASTGGNLMLNVSPKGDGSIPENQQSVLLAVGQWLRANGEGIYGSHAWRIPGEGPGTPAECPPDWKGGSTADQSSAIKPDPNEPRLQTNETSFRFTTANGNLYAFGYHYPASPGNGNGATAVIKSLSTSSAKVEHVTLLGPQPNPLTFKQTSEALAVTLPATAPIVGMPYTLRIGGTQGLGIG
jgi:alpha-L-fucosidase